MRFLHRNYIFDINRYYDYFFYDYDSGEGISIEKYDSIACSINEEYNSTINNFIRQYIAKQS